jgi:hypothetical protein
MSLLVSGRSSFPPVHQLSRRIAPETKNPAFSRKQGFMICFSPSRYVWAGSLGREQRDDEYFVLEGQADVKE